VAFVLAHFAGYYKDYLRSTGSLGFRGACISSPSLQDRLREQWPATTGRGESYARSQCEPISSQSQQRDRRSKTFSMVLVMASFSLFASFLRLLWAALALRLATVWDARFL
jgi:hypothetical protein